MSAYFFNLKCLGIKLNSISKMNINGSITDNFDTISSFVIRVSLIYTHLHFLSFVCHFLFFFNLENVNIISQENQILCDSPITFSDIKDAIQHLKCNKSPGSDIITAEFYKQFSETLAPSLFEVYCGSLKCSELPTTMTQSVICLIPKPKKDLLFIDN